MAAKTFHVVFWL